MLTNTVELPVIGGGRRANTNTFKRNPLVHVLITASLLCAARATSLLVNDASRERTFTIPAGAIADFGLRASHGRLYRGEVTAAALRVGAEQQWIVRLEQRNHQRAAHADLQVRVWMPETGIESASPVSATYIGRGEYRLDHVLLTRPGWWNVALVVNGRAGVDSLAFNVQMPERGN